MARINLKVPTYAALLVQHVKRHGNVCATDEARKLYGQATIDYALKQNMLTATIIKAIDPDNQVLPRRIPALYSSDWSRERPSWLDEYMKRLRD